MVDGEDAKPDETKGFNPRGMVGRAVSKHHHPKTHPNKLAAASVTSAVFDPANNAAQPIVTATTITHGDTKASKKTL